MGSPWRTSRGFRGTARRSWKSTMGRGCKAVETLWRKKLRRRGSQRKPACWVSLTRRENAWAAAARLAKSLSKKNRRFVSDAASPTRIDLRNDEKREIALEQRVGDLIHDLGVPGCFKGRGFVAAVSRKTNLGMRAHPLCGFRFSAHTYPVNRPVFPFSGGLGNSEVGRISASSRALGERGVG